MRVRDVVLVLQGHGFRHKRTTGSHRQFEGFVGGKRWLVTVAGNEGADLARPTLASIAPVRPAATIVPTHICQEGAATWDSKKNDRAWRSLARFS